MPVLNFMHSTKTFFLLIHIFGDHTIILCTQTKPQRDDEDELEEDEVE